VLEETGLSGKYLIINELKILGNYISVVLSYLRYTAAPKQKKSRYLPGFFFVMLLVMFFG